MSRTNYFAMRGSRYDSLQFGNGGGVMDPGGGKGVMTRPIVHGNIPLVCTDRFL
jgi:hypothetical protein